MGYKEYIKSPKFQARTKKEPEKIKKIESKITVPLEKVLGNLESFYYNILKELKKQGLSSIQAQDAVCKHIDEYIAGLMSIKEGIRED